MMGRIGSIKLLLALSAATHLLVVGWNRASTWGDDTGAVTLVGTPLEEGAICFAGDGQRVGGPHLEREGIVGNGGISMSCIVSVRPSI